MSKFKGLAYYILYINKEICYIFLENQLGY